MNQQLASIQTINITFHFRRINSGAGSRQYRLACRSEDPSVFAALIPTLAEAIAANQGWSEDDVPVVWGAYEYRVRKASYYPKSRELQVNVNRDTKLCKAAEEWDVPGAEYLAIPARLVVRNGRLVRVELGQWDPAKVASVA